jgi:hypothetical protein
MWAVCRVCPLDDASSAAISSLWATPLGSIPRWFAPEPVPRSVDAGLPRIGEAP